MRCCDALCLWWRRQESVGDARVERCLDAITARCKHLAPNGSFGSNSLTLPEVCGVSRVRPACFLARLYVRMSRV